MNQARVAEGALDYGNQGSVSAMLDSLRKSGKHVDLNLPVNKGVKVVDEYLDALTESILDHSPSLKDKALGGIENVKALVFTKLSQINREFSQPANDLWSSGIKAKDLRAHDGGLRGSINVNDVSNNIRNIALYINSVENDISYVQRRDKLGGDLKDLVVAEMRSVLIGSGLKADATVMSNGKPESPYAYSGKLGSFER